MRRFLVLLAAALATLAWARVGRPNEIPPIDRYFSKAELRRHHPVSRESRVYHGVKHTLNVRQMEFDLARGRGLSVKQATFLSEVALLHDWDPGRKRDGQARVNATLQLLADDFSGKRPLLKGYPRGHSVLKERFGWTERDLAVADAMIFRTSFPFGKAEAATYEDKIRALSPADQRLALREGALLSEYADKASTYAMESPARAGQATRGLAHEKNRDAGKGKRPWTAAKLDNAAFLATIGQPSNYAQDRAIARRLGFEIRFPSRARVFAMLPSHYGRTFAAQLKRRPAAKAGRRGLAPVASRGLKTVGPRGLPARQRVTARSSTARLAGRTASGSVRRSAR